MNFINFILTISLYASVAFAQATSFATLPTCASGLRSSLSSLNCAATDFQCLCDNSNFISIIQQTVQPKCNAVDQKETYQFAYNLCKSFGVTLSLPNISTSPESTLTATIPTTSTLVIASPSMNTFSTAVLPSALVTSPTSTPEDSIPALTSTGILSTLTTIQRPTCTVSSCAETFSSLPLPAEVSPTIMNIPPAATGGAVVNKAVGVLAGIGGIVMLFL